jgi:hypothetical protein
MEALEKTKAFAGEVWNRIHLANLAFGHQSGSESMCPAELKDAKKIGDYLERAKAILDGRSNDTRYKILTLGELDKSERRHFVGKDGEQRWNDGERVLAFEDGTLAFKESGSELWGTLDHAEHLACWIGLLDSFPQRWESGSPPK